MTILASTPFPLTEENFESYLEETHPATPFRRRNGRHCPIAKAIITVLGAKGHHILPEEINIGNHTCTYYDKDQIISCEMPSWAQDFIAMFDTWPRFDEVETSEAGMLSSLFPDDALRVLHRARAAKPILTTVQSHIHEEISE